MSDSTLPKSYSVNEFCEAERIARSTLYEMWREGRGPVYYLVGSGKGTRRRISEQSRQQWQERLRASTGSSTFITPIAETIDSATVITSITNK